jgi:hypothetical protein
MTGAGGSDTIRTEQRGFHWVAWVAASGKEEPAGGWLVVGRTQEEAEARVRELTPRTRPPRQPGP